MNNSQFKPSSQLMYSSKDLNAWFNGTTFTATKNAQTTHDFQITDDCLVDGGRVIAENVVFGDYVQCQIVDIDNVLGFGANLVLGQYINKWYLTPGINLQWDFSVPYPAKIYAGLYVRIIYNSVGTVNDVNVAVNFKLHKILW